MSRTTEGTCASARLQMRGESFALAARPQFGGRWAVLSLDEPSLPDTPCDRRSSSVRVLDSTRRPEGRQQEA